MADKELVDAQRSSETVFASPPRVTYPISSTEEAPRSGGLSRSMPEADADESGSEGGGGGAAGAARGVMGLGVVRPEDPILTVLP